jgi:hypothetical protein
MKNEFLKLCYPFIIVVYISEKNLKLNCNLIIWSKFCYQWKYELKFLIYLIYGHWSHANNFFNSFYL